MMGGVRDQLRQLQRRQVPAWWRDGKLGIMVHWTPASVPAFAPTEFEIGELLQSHAPDALSRTPYAEWYQNSLRFPDSPVSQHHRSVHGGRPYMEFARDWEDALPQWNPDDWARRFAATGARHVVFVAKHSDGYCLWPTDVRHPYHRIWHSTRDVVGEMAEAVRGAGMRFGLYYCGGFDWSFDDRPVGTMGDVVASVPRGEYPAYAAAQLRELISRYRPSVLWNDVAWPSSGKELWPLFNEYYALVPDGVVNDRWLPTNRVVSAIARSRFKGIIDAGARRLARRDGGLIPPAPPHFDVRTPEYVAFPDTQTRAWELVRGIDRSFGYNAAGDPAHLLSRGDLVWSLGDAVAKGGNLLLNVGPRGVDAQIPPEQVQRLDWLAQWMGANRSSVVATRPWVVSGSATVEGCPVRYNALSDTVHALVQTPQHTVTLPEIAATSATSVTTIDGVPLEFFDRAAGVEVHLPADVVAAGEVGPVAIVLRAVHARPAR